VLSILFISSSTDHETFHPLALLGNRLIVACARVRESLAAGTMAAESSDAAVVTSRTQLAADLEESLTRHARANEGDVSPLDETRREAVNAQQAWLDSSMKQTSLMLSSRGDTPRGDTPRGGGSEATPEPPNAGAAGAGAAAAAVVTPRTQLALDLETSLTRHARAKEADVAPLDETRRDAVSAQQAWLYSSMKQTSLMLSSRGDTPRSVASDGNLQPTAPPALPPPISASIKWSASNADDFLPKRATLGSDEASKLDPESAEIDKAAREEAVRAQQGWMAGLLMQMSQSFSPRDSKRSSVYGGESQMPSTLGSPVASPVGPTEPNGHAEESAADKAAREEALRSQQGWLADLLAAMSNRNSINSVKTDSNRARSAADLTLADGAMSESDRAAREEALRAQQGWLAGMLYGMQSFMGQSSESLAAAENAEGSDEHKTEEQKEADRKAREEALRAQQGWLAGLLAGMSRDSLLSVPREPLPPTSLPKLSSSPGLRSTSPEQRSITSSRSCSPGLLRRESSVLVGSPMRAGAGKSICLPEEEDEAAARAWEIEQAWLALEAAQREADAHSGIGPVRVFQRAAKPVVLLRETPLSTVQTPTTVQTPSTRQAAARVTVQVAADLQQEVAAEDQGAVFVPDMTVYSHLARKQVRAHASAVVLNPAACARALSFPVKHAGKGMLQRR
jgi:hypothetical protein